MADEKLQVDIQVSYDENWLKLEIPTAGFEMKAVRVTFNTEIETEAFLDRFEALVNAHSSKKLTLEKITTKYTKNASISKAEFGNIFETLYDTVNDQVQDGDAALSLVTKQ